MRETLQELGMRTVLTRRIRLANTRFSDCVRPVSLLNSIPSSNFGKAINFTLSARVLHAASKTPWQDTRLPLKAQRRSLPGFSRPDRVCPPLDLQTSTTRIRY